MHVLESERLIYTAPQHQRLWCRVSMMLTGGKEGAMAANTSQLAAFPTACQCLCHDDQRLCMCQAMVVFVSHKRRGAAAALFC
jgi:hypothetical protein